MFNTPDSPAKTPDGCTPQGGNYWTLFTPGIWKVLHAVSQARAQRVDLKTLTRHRDLYVQVRAAAAARRAQEEEARHLAAIDKVEGMARELAKRGRRLTLRNAQGLGVGGIMPSSAEAAVFSLMRFGLGDRSARLSASATRLGHRFILRINESIVRLRAEIEGDQLQLALSPD